MKRQTPREELAQAVRVATNRTKTPFSVHSENGRIELEATPEPHTGKVIFTGTIREVIAFLDGFIFRHEMNN